MNIVLQCSNPSPISPHKVVPLNFATGLSGLGLCLTYIFVLLQLRISEEQYDGANDFANVQ